MDSGFVIYIVIATLVAATVGLVWALTLRSVFGHRGRDEKPRSADGEVRASRAGAAGF